MKPKKPVNPQKLSPGQKLVERADFVKVLHGERRIERLSHVEVILLDRRKVTYKTRDLDKIPFPVLDVVLQFERGSGEFVYQVKRGEGYTKDRRRVKPNRKS